MELLNALRWRYAAKHFDTDKKVGAEDRERLMQAINLTASSFGLQGYRVVIVEDPAVKERLRKASFDQAQITECHLLFVFAAKKEVSPAYVDDYMQRMADIREIPVDQVSGFGEYIKGSLADKPEAFISNWNARQCYLGLSTLLAAAAQLRIDTCPMEGFVPAQYDDILGLSERGLTASVIAAVGYRAATDETAHHRKVRLPLREMFRVV